MPRPPNLLILCADQFRGDMLGANGLNADVRTPHMDAVASRGVNFRRHFTTFPKCVPARVSMMTGRYTHTDGYRTITQLMPPGTPDLASHLKSRGYQLFEFGRNHCWQGMLDATHTPPRGEGLRFDGHAWTPPFSEIWDRHTKDRPKTTQIEPATKADGRGLVFADDGNGWAADEAVTEMAERFLRDGLGRGDGLPWFCQVNFGKPHTPYETGEPWFSMYDRDTIAPLPFDLPENPPICAVRQREVRGRDYPDSAFLAVQATYMAMCSRVDALIGRLAAVVPANTVVVMTSDHGDYAGQYGLVEKWDNHFPDCLMHVPLAIVADGLTPGVRDDLSSHADLAPTLCDLLGVGRFAGIHGRSMLDGEPRDAVFADGGHEAEMRARFDGDVGDPRGVGGSKQETYRLYPESMARAKMVRTGRWKLVWRETGDHELYDLAADRWEMNNVFAESAHDAVRLDLQGRLLDWSLPTDPDRPRQARVGA